LTELTKEEKLYGYFKQKNATVHTANYSRAALKDVFSEISVTIGQCPTISPDVNPYGCYLCGTRKGI
jgi:hypothetical protein